MRAATPLSGQPPRSARARRRGCLDCDAGTCPRRTPSSVCDSSRLARSGSGRAGVRPGGAAGQVAAAVGGAEPLRGGRGPRGHQAAQVHARHVPLPLRRPPHGARRGLRDRRRRRALLVPEGLQRPASDRVGLLRPARRERGHQAQRPPRRVDVQEHRDAGELVQALRHLLRLVATPAHQRRGVLPLEPVAVHPLLRAGPGLPQGRPGQLVPAGPDRARQRAGRGGQVRALRCRRDPPRADAVVLQDH